MFGIITAAALAVCAFFVQLPPADYQPPAPAKQKKRWVNPVAEETPTGTMLRKPTFWLYYLWAIALSAVGLAVADDVQRQLRSIRNRTTTMGVNLHASGNNIHTFCVNQCGTYHRQIAIGHFQNFTV